MIEKKMHRPIADRTTTNFVEPPPLVVAIVGPPGSGKSTVIRSLVKRYTRQTLHEIKGPITIVTGKKRRLTFIECGNDLNSMIDVGKVADLVILLINAKLGFQMETLNSEHFTSARFPAYFGCPDALGPFQGQPGKDESREEEVEATFLDRNLPGRQVILYLTGTLHGRYLPMETMNLSRFISVVKLRPLIWRNSHPYVIADRYEDLTRLKQLELIPNVIVPFVLWLFEGIPLRPNSQQIHIPGAGDFKIDNVFLPDPVPPESDKSINAV